MLNIKIIVVKISKKLRIKAKIKSPLRLAVGNMPERDLTFFSQVRNSCNTDNIILDRAKTLIGLNVYDITYS